MDDCSLDPAPAPDIVVRHAAADEVEALVALDARCFPSSDSVAQQAYTGEIEAGVIDGLMLVVTVGADLVGLCHYSPKAPERWFVENIAVDECWRGQGVGRTLLETALVEIEAACPGAAVGCTIAPSNAASRALFARHGFAATGFVEDYYGPGKDRLLFERPGSGAPGAAP